MCVCIIYIVQASELPQSWVELISGVCEHSVLRIQGL